MSRSYSRGLLRRRPLVWVHVLPILLVLAGCRQMDLTPRSENELLSEPDGWQAKLDRAVRIEPHDILWVTATRAGAEKGQPADLEGRYLVEPDGAIRLGRFGSVHVGGKSLAAARRAVEHHLRGRIDEPTVTMAPARLNSPYYYVVVQESGQPERVTRVPLTPGDTVLDAISKSGGIARPHSTDIWIARYAKHADGPPTEQILPVDWVAITQGGMNATNYTLGPGDHIYVVEDECRGGPGANLRSHVPAPPVRFCTGLTSIPGVASFGGGSTIRNFQSLGRSDY